MPRESLVLIIVIVAIVVGIWFGAGTAPSEPRDLTPLPWATDDRPWLRAEVARLKAENVDLYARLQRAETARNNYARAVIELKCTPETPQRGR